MTYTKEEALRFAKLWAVMLDISGKDIKIISGPKRPGTVASVRIFRRGERVKGGEDFDTIVITIFDIDESKSQEWFQGGKLFGMIGHEMLHVKRPQWSEEEVSQAFRDILAEILAGAEGSGVIE